jgi:predicted ATPase/DNA-binding transcriptional MerR regulator
MAYQYKLNSITMNDGTVVCPGKLTVLIGPNNSGKSCVLKEIVARVTAPRVAQGRIVSAVDINYPSSIEELNAAYGVERQKDDDGRWYFRTLNSELNEEHWMADPTWPMHPHQWLRWKIDDFKNSFALQFGPAMVAYLTTQARLNLVQEGKSAARDGQARSLLQTLYNAGSSGGKNLSELVKRAFSQEVALDFTAPTSLLLRVADDFSQIPADPRDARPLMQKFERLDEQGDGIRSFVGIIVALSIIKRGLFVIDEPEAFLHPPQAFRIGSFIADQVTKPRQIVIATHSVDVLRGILMQTDDVNIVRIDRVGNTNTFRQLDAKSLKEIIKNPLLSSARVLDGLFYSAAVVVEADSDARFYHAASLKREPNLDLHFVNADNKQTVPGIVKLYRDMGVRAAGIVDFDVLNDRAELGKSLQTLGLSTAEIQALLNEQQLIAQATKELPSTERLNQVRQKLDEISGNIDQLRKKVFSTPEEEQREKDSLLKQLEGRFRELAETTKPWKALKQSGIATLSLEAGAAFARISNACAGELESTLADLGIPWTTDKKGWIAKALKLIPSLQPDDSKSPWNFLKKVHDHLQGLTGPRPSPAAGQTTSAGTPPATRAPPPP